MSRHNSALGIMPNVVEADRPNVGFGPQLAPISRTAPQGCVRSLLDVTAALSSADMSPTGNDARPTKCTPQDMLETGILAEHRTIGGWKYELGRGAFDCALEVRHQFRGYRDPISVTTLGGFPVVGPRYREQARAQVHVRLAKPGEFALAKPGIYGSREQR